jgi:hypothetical protein
MAMYDGNIAVVLAGDMDETKEIKKKKQMAVLLILYFCGVCSVRRMVLFSEKFCLPRGRLSSGGKT